MKSSHTHTRKKETLGKYSKNDRIKGNEQQKNERKFTEDSNSDVKLSYGKFSIAHSTSSDFVPIL